MSNMHSKIQAILRKAESSTHPEEAEAFWKKAQELMKKHQIEASVFHDDGTVTIQEGVTEIRSNEYDDGTQASVKYDLEEVVAVYFGCRVIRVTWRKHSNKPALRCYLRIFGLESALVVHQNMFPFIWKQVNQLAASASTTPAGQKRMVRDISRALASRLWELRAERQREEQQAAASPTSSTALVVASDATLNAMLDAKIQEEFPDLKERKPSKVQPPSQLALVLAKSVSLDPQIGA